MHEIHVLPIRCGEFAKFCFIFAFPRAFDGVIKRVKDATDNNRKNVIRNCGMWVDATEFHDTALGY
jgi:hypothetical protein